jgi:hypothetical protein
LPSICIAHTTRKKTDDTWRFLKTKQILNGKKKKKKKGKGKGPEHSGQLLMYYVENEVVFNE